MKQAIRGDILKVSKITVKSPSHKISSPLSSPKASKGSPRSSQGVIPALKEFNLKLVVLPDSVIKINHQHLGRALTKSLPHYIDSLIAQIKIAVKEAVTETKEYARDHANHTRSVSAIPFYGFCEGPTMISDMEDICLSHFNSLVSSKVCLIAIKFKADVKFLKKAFWIMWQARSLCKEKICSIRNLKKVVKNMETIVSFHRYRVRKNMYHSYYDNVMSL